MSNQDFSLFLSDPLSEITRKERRNSLLASTVGISIAVMGIVPTKVSAIGIDFSAPEQNSFLILVAAVVFYFLCAFLFYGVADFFAWRQKYQSYLEEAERASRQWSWEDERDRADLYANLAKADWVYDFNLPVARARLAFDFAVPVVASGVALVLLVLKID